MRKLALLVPLILVSTACQNFTWEGQGAGLSDQQAQLGVRDVDSLTREYETLSFFAGLRRRGDGLSNAAETRPLQLSESSWIAEFSTICGRSSRTNGVSSVFE